MAPSSAVVERACANGMEQTFPPDSSTCRAPTMSAALRANRSRSTPESHSAHGPFRPSSWQRRKCPQATGRAAPQDLGSRRHRAFSRGWILNSRQGPLICLGPFSALPPPHAPLISLRRPLSPLDNRIHDRDIMSTFGKRRSTCNAEIEGSDRRDELRTLWAPTVTIARECHKLAQ